MSAAVPAPGFTNFSYTGSRESWEWMAQTFLLERCKSMFPNSGKSTYVNHYHRWAATTSLCRSKSELHPACIGAAIRGWITGMSDLVVFSAAVPGQSKHQTLHERWPSYWRPCSPTADSRVSTSCARSFECDQRVDWWYSQNMLVFVSEFREDLLNRLPSTGRATMLDIVHPRAFECFRTEASVGGDAQLQLYPFRVIEAGYEGHDILQIDTDTFLAREDRGPMLSEKLVAAATRAYVGASSDEVKARIPSEMFPVSLVEEGYEGAYLAHRREQVHRALQRDGPYSPRSSLPADTSARMSLLINKVKRAIKLARA